MRNLVAAVLALGLPACSGKEAATQPAAGKAEAPAEARALEVGYDVRRLRPRDGETLEAMFERMRKQAVADGKRVAVLFSAAWCEPCRALELELGNMHAAALIGDFRILELKEEDWDGATRMGEFNNLRRKWYAPVGSYPVFVVIDEQGGKVEEMKEAIARLQEAGVEPTVPNWFKSVVDGQAPTASGAG